MPDSVQQLIDRVGGLRRMAIAAVGIAAVALVLVVSRWASQPAWVPVFSGLSIENVGQMTDKLDQAGIQYRLERGGADLMVGAPELARARVVLAKDGLPTSGRPGLELFDQPSWAMTDFTQRINYRRALEGELERTIGKMRGVEAAQVHLALHETATFRNGGTPAEASVVLKTRGAQPAQDVVQGIAHLVASSVDGLTSENVTIVDDSGRLLSTPNEPGSIIGLTSRQLTVQREVEQHLRAKAEELLTDMVGTGNARVQISAAINFDHVARTTQLMDPDKQVAAAEQKAEIVPGAQGGAGSSNTATSYENSKSVETFDGAIGNLRRLTVAVLVNDVVPAAAGANAQTPPAPAKRTAEELARIDTLVKSAIGFDPARGDIVSVVSMPFSVVAPTPIEAPKVPVLTRIQENQKIIVSGLGLAMAMVVAIMALNAVKRAPAPAGALAAGGAAAVGGGSAAQALGATLQSRVITANSQQRDKVVATVDDQPDVAAKLVRAWMKD
jgi:flagellar M-ring protein FliF